MADSTFSYPIKLTLQYALTVLVLYGLTVLLPQYIAIHGTFVALPAIAALLLLLNLVARPILRLLTLPIKLFATLPAVILGNALFLWLLQRVTENLDPTQAELIVTGGWGGWIVVALLLGIANWILHHIVR